MLLIVAFVATPGAIPYRPAGGAGSEGLLGCARATAGTGPAHGGTYLRFLLTPPEYALPASTVPAVILSKFQRLAISWPGPESRNWVRGGAIHL